MTWAEWVDSEYNISSRYSLSGTHVYSSDNCAVYKTSTGFPVKTSEVIENTSYYEMGGPLPPE